ncbi:hypothetical protein EDC96DRAFT_580835 [Choanephora cucurbitarum]|nr:hypothetical protein EDC96DRAFT_580835 [Choanephora cucurbitarum]
MQQHPSIAFDRFQRANIEDFKNFRHQMTTAYCAIYMRLFYPTNHEIDKITRPESEHTPEISQAIIWKFEPLRHPKKPNCVLVCPQHRVRNLVDPILPISCKTNEQNKSGMSQRRAYCGHYGQSGTPWFEHNLEFAQMLFGGLNETPIMRGIMEPINVEKENVHKNILQIFQKRSRRDPETSEWLHNYVMSLNEGNPVVAEKKLDNHILAVDSSN